MTRITMGCMTKMNHGSKPLDTSNHSRINQYRQAVNYAINKTSIVENLYKGTAIVAKNGMPPFMLGWNDAVVDYPYNPVKARELLNESRVSKWV